MTFSWHDFAVKQTELADLVAGRFAANLHHVLATVGQDGGPRLWGLEVRIRAGHLWLGMMPGSVKAADLRRDPRFALHSAPVETDMKQGDAKVYGTAVDVSHEVGMVAAFTSETDLDPTTLDGSGMALFWTDISRVVLTRVQDDQLTMDTWTPAGGAKVHKVG